MGAEVVPFPSAAAPAFLAPALVARVRPQPRRRYSFADLVRAFALNDGEMQIRTQIEYLRRMHCEWGMPLPLNPRRWRGKLQTGAAAIGQRSQWCALEFDAWADSHRNPPPAAEAAKVPPLPVPVRHDCAARARQLAGVPA